MSVVRSPNDDGNSPSILLSMWNETDEKMRCSAWLKGSWNFTKRTKGIANYKMAPTHSKTNLIRPSFAGVDMPHHVYIIRLAY